MLLPTGEGLVCWVFACLLYFKLVNIESLKSASLESQPVPTSKPTNRVFAENLVESDFS